MAEKIIIGIFLIFVSCSGNKPSGREIPHREHPVLIEPNPECARLEAVLIPMLFTKQHQKALGYLKKTCRGTPFLKDFLGATDLELRGNSFSANIKYIDLIKKLPENFQYLPLKRFARARVDAMNAWSDNQISELNSHRKAALNDLPVYTPEKESLKKSSKFCITLKPGEFTLPSWSCTKFKHTVKISCSRNIMGDLFFKTSGHLFINGKHFKSYSSPSETGDSRGLTRLVISQGHTIIEFYTATPHSFLLKLSDSHCRAVSSISNKFSRVIEDKSVEFFHAAADCASGNHFTCRKTLSNYFKNSDLASLMMISAITSDPSIPSRSRSRLISSLGINFSNSPMIASEAKAILPEKSSLQCIDCRRKHLTNLINSGKLDQAYWELNTLLRKQGSDYRLYFPASVISLRKGDLRRSMEWLRLESNLRSGKNNLPSAFFKLKMDDSIIVWFKTRSKTHIFDADTILVVAASYIRKGLFTQALNLLKRFYKEFSSYENFAVKILDLMDFLDLSEETENFVTEHLGNYPSHRMVFQMAAQKYPGFPIATPSDTFDIINKYKNINPEDTDSFFLIDETITRVFKTGSGYHFVRKLIKIQTSNAVDQYGEITPPDNSEIHILTIIKPDGREILPLVTAGKPSISMRNIEPGDVVRFEYFVPFKSPGLGVFWGPRFHFTNSSTPILNSIYTLVHPPGMKISYESTGRIPKPVTGISDGQATISFSRHFNAPLNSEKRMAEYSDYFPTIRLTGNMTPEIYRSLVRMGETNAQSFDVYLQIKKICFNKKDCIPALIRWIGNNISQKSTVTNPLEVFWNRVGSRVHLFSYMAQMAGIKNRIVYAVPSRHLISWTSYPDPAIFTIPLVKLQNGSLLDLRFIVDSNTFNTPALSGSIYLDAESRNFTGNIPTIAASSLKSTGTLDCRFNGYCMLLAKYTYDGFPAARRIEQFKGFDNNQIKLFIENHTLSRIFPASVLKSFLFKPRGKNGLQISWKLQVPYYKGSSGISVRTFHQKLSMAKTFSVHKNRRLPLLTVYNPELTLNLKIIPPAGYITETEIPLGCTSDFGKITRVLSKEPQGGGFLKINRTLKYQVIKPNLWKHFRKYSMCVDNVESQEILFRPVSD
ncbi:DUF3857 domain-containing protein [bacterium]|nr:DUF3857 domain-containing protein [bacterium]MBU1434685.1 DUF3857 domain-containing protein [bacterium]MBU1502672.1 DUF3857 domain-containing protein [bacterium]